MQKIYLYLIFCFTLGNAIHAQTVEKGNTPEKSATGKGEIKFEKELHNFDTLEYASNGTYEFKFKNTGSEPVIITDAKASCGCTVPVYPKNTPIKSGDSETIKVTYDTKRPGTFNKSITIYSNAKEPVKVINIKGFVKNKPVEATAFPVDNTPKEGFVPLDK